MYGRKILSIFEIFFLLWPDVNEIPVRKIVN